MCSDFDVLQAFDGDLDELRVWKRTRSAEEIRTFMNLSITAVANETSFGAADMAVGLTFDDPSASVYESGIFRRGISALVVNTVNFYQRVSLIRGEIKRWLKWLNSELTPSVSLLCHYATR